MTVKYVVLTEPHQVPLAKLRLFYKDILSELAQSRKHVYDIIRNSKPTYFIGTQGSQLAVANYVRSLKSNFKPASQIKNTNNTINLMLHTDTTTNVK